MDNKLNILVIDDDDVDRMSVRRFLKTAGFKLAITEASDGKQGLEILKESAFDCAFLDYFLPDSNGLEILKAARADGIETPIIMLTGHGDVRLAVEMMQAGATDYLPKGEMSAENLSHSLNHAIKVYKLEQERAEAIAELTESNKRIVNILESISDAFFALDEKGCTTYINQQAERILQANRDALLGNNLVENLPSIASWFKEAMEKALIEKASVSCEGEYELLSIWLEVQIYPGNDGISVYFRDITKRKKSEEYLSHLANYDALTDLPNRVLLMDRLTQALTRAPWHKRSVAVLFCDLDRFKIINDTLGHNVGDHLLKTIASRFQESIRAGDTVSRLGGDEFVILLTDLAKPEDVGKITQKIIDRISDPLMLEGHEVFVTASIGISIFPDDGGDPNVLLKQADVAMYCAKDKGKNNYQMYSPELEAQTADRLTLESALRRSFERDELRVHYQPQIDIQTNIIIGVEALVRWEHPERGMISPADFLPIAEETGLIATIDEWVLKTACEQNVQWRKLGLPPIRVAVNLSDQIFHKNNLVKLVRKILTETNLAADGLELELTEAVVMSDVEHSLKILNQLREMGIQLAIDDFGTGYSSLGYLKHYPIHTVKIDRSFVNDITTDSNDAAIVEAIIAMSHKLKLNVLAEGVETDEQQNYLIKSECDFMQGFLFSRPLAADDFTELLKGQSNKR